MLMLKLCSFLVICLLLVDIFTTQAINLADRNAEVTLYRVAPTDEYGVYKYAYATSNGINVQAAGSPLEAIGIYSYTAPDGQRIEVRYIADELGFHAVGRHLPKPPPIPDYIVRSLEYIKNHPNQENRWRNRVYGKKLRKIRKIRKTRKTRKI